MLEIIIERLSNLTVLKAVSAIVSFLSVD